VTIWYGSGFADPYHWFSDPDPAFFVRGWQDPTNNIFSSLLFEGTFTSVFKNKVKKKPKHSRNRGFSYFFACWWKEPDPDLDPYKIMIRIHNTDGQSVPPPWYGQHFLYSNTSKEQWPLNVMWYYSLFELHIFISYMFYGCECALCNTIYLCLVINRYQHYMIELFILQRRFNTSVRVLISGVPCSGLGRSLGDLLARPPLLPVRSWPHICSEVTAVQYSGFHTVPTIV